MATAGADQTCKSVQDDKRTVDEAVVGGGELSGSSIDEDCTAVDGISFAEVNCVDDDFVDDFVDYGISFNEDEPVDIEVFIDECLDFEVVDDVVFADEAVNGKDFVDGAVDDEVFVDEGGFDDDGVVDDGCLVDGATVDEDPDVRGALVDEIGRIETCTSVDGEEADDITI